MSAQGIWPDGSSGAKRADFCITCGLLEVRPERTCFNDGKEAEFTDVDVLPASLGEELVERLERVAEAGEGRHPEEAWRVAKLIAEDAVARYREAVAEGGER